MLVPRWFVLAIMSISSVYSNADTVKGEIIFDKKASFSGVVYMTGKETKTSPSPSNQSFVDQKDKRFTKKMVVTHTGSTIMFKNSDAIDHNIFANDPGTGIKFDVGLMSPAQEKSITFDWEENSLVRFGCKIHPKMKSYIFASPTEYFQVLEFEKKVKTYPFVLENVPANLLSLSLKIPKYEEFMIDLKNGESKQVDVMRKGKKKATMNVSRSD
ncbi:MAG: hypothetical protein COA99_06005 [Moraxellaceae bacterium]|nr:MAG: hypothetical protein COA99_06005 [Moraxellaceae bacterium]